MLSPSRRNETNAVPETGCIRGTDVAPTWRLANVDVVKVPFSRVYIVGIVGSPVEETLRKEFEAFVHDIEPSLRRALVAAYGFERGRDATAEALGWAWEHWDRAKELDNKMPTFSELDRVGAEIRRHRSHSSEVSRVILGSILD